MYNLKKFPGVIPPDPRRSVPGAWTQTPISACLAGVPIVPILRNDNCDTHSHLACSGKTVFHCWSHFCFVSASSNNYTQRNPRTVSKLASWKAAEQPYVIFRTGYYAVTQLENFSGRRGRVKKYGVWTLEDKNPSLGSRQSPVGVWCEDDNFP